MAGLLDGAARAQDARPAPQSPQPAAADTVAAQNPPAAGQDPVRADDRRPGTIRRGGDGELVSLAFNDVPVPETISFIVETTGKVVMPIQTDLLKAKKITLVNDELMTKDEALDLLFRAFRLNDVGVIETEDVIILTGLELLTNVGNLPVLTSQDDIMRRADTGTLVIKIFRLSEAEAEGVGEKISENFPSYAKLTVDPNSNQIVVYGDVGLCQQVQKLINELDRNFIQVKTQTFRLAHADASEIQQNIYDLFEEDPQQQQTTPTRRITPRRGQTQRGGAAVPGQPGPVAPLRVTINVQQNTVTVQAEPTIIAQVSDLIYNQWDLPRPTGTSKVYVLEYTDPIKMRDLLREILGQGTGGAGRAPTQPGQRGAGGPADVGSIVSGVYRIEANPDANSLVVLSKTEESFEFLDNLIAELDQPSDVGLPTVVPLKHANAVSLAEELNALLAEAGAGIALTRPEEGLSAQGFASGGGAEGGATGGTSGTGTLGQGGGGQGQQLQFPWQRGRPRDDQAEPSPLIGKVRIMPIVRQNALAILAPISYRHSIVELIQEFDQPGRQVLISAIIVAVQLTDDMALGLRFSSGDLNFTNLDNLVSGSATFAGSDEGFLDDLFDTALLDVNVDVNVALQALAQKTNVKVLQEPRVFTADNQEAVFFDGQDVPFITDSNVTDVGGLTQSFDYRQVGVLLNVRPRITAQKDVDLEINLELSSIVAGETLFGGAIIDRRTTNTQVIVKNGQTIVLSGILKDTESKIKRGLPFLSDIPIIGDLFASHETEQTTTELVAFITPTVVENPSENDANFNLEFREQMKELMEAPTTNDPWERQRRRDSIRNRIAPEVDDADDRPQPVDVNDLARPGSGTSMQGEE